MTDQNKLQIANRRKELIYYAINILLVTILALGAVIAFTSVIFDIIAIVVIAAAIIAITIIIYKILKLK